MKLLTGRITAYAVFLIPVCGGAVTGQAQSLDQEAAMAKTLENGSQMVLQKLEQETLNAYGGTNAKVDIGTMPLKESSPKDDNVVYQKDSSDDGLLVGVETPPRLFDLPPSRRSAR